MYIFLIFIIGCIVIFGGFYLFMIIKDYIDDNYVIPKKVENSLKRVEEKAKEMSKYEKGIYLVEDKLGIFLYKDGDVFYNCNSFSYPLFQKFDGTYTVEESDDCVYIGYCEGNELYKNKDRNGNVGNYDRLGNPIIESYHSNSPIIDYGFAEDYVSGSSGGSIEDDYDPLLEVHKRSEWRADGSWGDVYYKGGVQTDEHGNPL